MNEKEGIAITKLQPPVNKNDHKTGNIDSGVVLVEYGDYECPYCGEAYWTIKKLIGAIGNNFCFVFRNFPLREIHPHALHAAYAAEAAGKQNKFWDMHDKLYENQDNLSDEDLLQYAQALDMVIEKFEKDFTSLGIEEKVQSDFMSGIESGVNGTPTFFLNGVRFDEGYSYNILLSALQEEIKAHQYE